MRAQERIHVDLKKTQFKISFLNPAAMAEFRLAKQQTFNISVGLILSAAQTAVTNETLIYLHPVTRGSFRHYYGRKYVRKNLRQNSGNFIEFVGGYIFNSIAGRDDYISPASSSFFIGPAWGLQRNYESGFLFGLGLGLGYINGQNTSGGITSTGHMTIGFAFN
jgi:hypothetical protein